MSPDKLVYMANQIGKFFVSQGHDMAVTATVEHLTKFWDPRMRTAIVAHVEAGGAGLDPCAREAVERLRAAQRKELDGAAQGS
jgi:formate dehydrogenase subunit delta